MNTLAFTDTSYLTPCQLKSQCKEQSRTAPFPFVVVEVAPLWWWWLPLLEEVIKGGAFHPASLCVVLLSFPLWAGGAFLTSLTSLHWACFWRKRETTTQRRELESSTRPMEEER